MRPGGGGDRPRRRRPGHRRGAVRRRGPDRDPGGGQPPGFCPVRPGWAGAGAGAGAAGAAAVHPLPAGNLRPLRGLHAAVHAFSGGYPDENL